jgi:hypothetical protein
MIVSLSIRRRVSQNVLFDCNYHDWFADGSKTWTALPVRCNTISSGNGSGLRPQFGCANACQF